MKYKSNYLKSALPALALLLLLLKGTIPPCPAAESPFPFPVRPVIEEGIPESNGEGEYIQPLSDLDEIKKDNND